MADGADSDQEQEEEITYEIHVPANHELAENLKGKLLPGKAHGFGGMQDYFQRMLQEYS